MCRSRETLFAETEVEFYDLAGTHQRIPCVIVVRIADGALLDVRMHLDGSSIPDSARQLK